MWVSPFMPQLSQCQSPDLFSKVWLAMQWLHTAQFLSLGEASTNQKWASWARVLCLQWWKNLWNLHWWKKYFPHCFFSPQHLLSPGSSLHSFTTMGWKSLLHLSCGHQLPFTQPPSHFSIFSDLREMDFLSCLFSLFPATLTAWRLFLYSKISKSKFM